MFFLVVLESAVRRKVSFLAFRIIPRTNPSEFLCDDDNYSKRTTVIRHTYFILVFVCIFFLSCSMQKLKNSNCGDIVKTTEQGTISFQFQNGISVDLTLDGSVRVSNRTVKRTKKITIHFKRPCSVCFQRTINQNVFLVLHIK